MTGLFVRLAAIICCQAWALAMVEAARWEGWLAGLGVAAGGLVAAVMLAEDWHADERPRKPEPRRAGWPGRPVSPTPEPEPADFEMEDA